LKSWFGQYSLLLLLLLALTSTVSCSKLPSLLTGGTNVAANVQVGKTNTQTLGTTNNIAPTVSDSSVGRVDQSITTTKLKTDKVNTIVVNEIPVWLVLLFGLLCGFLIPSPQEIIRSIVGLFRRK
jgi:hypothetical protein